MTLKELSFWSRSQWVGMSLMVLVLPWCFYGFYEGLPQWESYQASQVEYQGLKETIQTLRLKTRRQEMRLKKMTGSIQVLTSRTGSVSSSELMGSFKKAGLGVQQFVKGRGVYQVQLLGGYQQWVSWLKGVSVLRQGIDIDGVVLKLKAEKNQQRLSIGFNVKI